MRRSLAILFTGGLLFLGSLGLAIGANAATTIGPTTTCSNDYQTAVAGLGIICEVTVVNTITATGGSATVTVHECHGPAGPPPVQAACTTQTTNLGEPVTAVTQCNGSINGGGTTLRCSIQVTNNFIGVAPGEAAVSVNQCVGSGGGGGTAINCDPFPATTTGAAITQCNGTASGGGGSMTCTATGTMASAHGVTINQCNGSSNGNGDLVICSANIDNNAVAASTAPSTAPTAGRTAPPTAPPTDTLEATDATGPALLAIALLAIFLLAFVGTTRWLIGRIRAE
jgi:hypothetical protein